MAEVTSYPLAWPPGWKRTDQFVRRSANFGVRARGVTIAEGCTRVLRSLSMMGIPDYQVIVSTNLKPRLDGMPRSDQQAPLDPGAAVYWRDGDHQRCIAVDQYTKVEDNLAAIAATLEAMRAIERHGGAAILNRAFTGFTALPAPGQTTGRGWMQVMEFQPNEKITLAMVDDRYRRLSVIRHPDKGGSETAMSELNWARAQAREALRG